VLIDHGSWLTALRRHLGAMASGSLVCESAHMPLYTLWESGMGRAIALLLEHYGGALPFGWRRSRWPWRRFPITWQITQAR
jgi:hypothetical protein